MKADAKPLSIDEALAMIAVCFNEPPENVNADTVRSALAGWDSMGVLMLTAELDERFGVELEAAESARMLSIADLLKFLRARHLLRD